MLRRPRQDLLVLFGFAAISFGYFGWRLLPHPGRLVIGAGHDPEIFIWSFAWWPHAIGSGLNPFVSHALYSPTGVNVTWTASSPGLALIFSPVTVLFGPVASYNTAAVVLPALAAWTAYLLCRHLTSSIWASLIGGYLFGFSSAILRQQLSGHLHMTAVFLLPLIALSLVRYFEAQLRPSGLAWRLAVLVAAQLWISTEIAFTSTVVLAIGLVVAVWAFPDLRPRLRSSLAPIATGYALAAVLVSPFLVYVAVGFQSKSFVFAAVRDAGTDLLQFVVPTPVLGLGGTSLASVRAHFLSGGDSGYLGLPVVLIVAMLCLRSWRAPGTRFLATMLAVCAALALGTTLEIDGHKLIALPWWNAAAHLPLFDNLLPFRFTTFAALAAAVIVARWIATTKGRIYARPYLLPALAVLALVPAVWRSSYPTFEPSHPERSAFFANGLFKTCIRQGETVAIFPFGGDGDSMLLQAESGFWFRLAANGLQPAPRHGKPLTSFDGDPVVADLTFSAISLPTMDQLLAFAANHHVDRFISFADSGYPSEAQMRSLGPTQAVGGVLVAPACGQPSLVERNLTPFVRRAAEQTQTQKTTAYCLDGRYYTIPNGFYPARLIKGATPAMVVAGHGLTCLLPAGYKHHGFATPDMGMPANTYPFYSP